MAYQFQEGNGPYTVTVGVTNASTKAGQPWPATLSMDIVVSGPNTYLQDTKTANFAAGERKTWSFSFSIPLGDIGAGDIQVAVYDPNNVQLDAASVGYTIEEVPIDYGADVDVT